MPAAADATKAAERGITITRVFNAPRALVFKAWTDAGEHGGASVPRQTNLGPLN